MSKYERSVIEVKPAQPAVTAVVHTLTLTEAEAEVLRELWYTRAPIGSGWHKILSVLGKPSLHIDTPDAPVVVHEHDFPSLIQERDALRAELGKVSAALSASQAAEAPVSRFGIDAPSSEDGFDDHLTPAPKKTWKVQWREKGDPYWYSLTENSGGDPHDRMLSEYELKEEACRAMRRRSEALRHEFNYRVVPFDTPDGREKE